MNEFIDYVMSFYGQNGIYDIGATRNEILNATNVHLEKCKGTQCPFEGDTVDRECVRDIMLELRKTA